MSDFANIIKQLKNGELPPELDFRKQEQQQIDWRKLQFNAFYRSPTFFESKFEPGWQNIPGFEKVIKSMADNAQSPLEEMIERQQEATIKEDKVEEEEIISN